MCWLKVPVKQEIIDTGGIMAAEVGDVAPDFNLPSTDQGDVSLSSFRGEKSVVLSFHVFDFTAG